MNKHPPIYQEGHQIMKAELAQLRAAVDEVSSYAPDDLMTSLREAVICVEEACEANKTITKGGRACGAGIDKAKKAIACDTAIAVIRQIKAVRAW